MTMTQEVSEVVIVQLGDALPTDLVVHLRDRGYVVNAVNRLDRILSAWSSYRLPILIIDCSSSVSVAQRTVTTLGELRHVLCCPIIIAAPDRRRYASRLGRYFSIVTTLPVPARVDTVLALVGVVERARGRLEEGFGLAIDPPPPDIDPPAGDSTSNETLGEAVARSIERRTALVFDPEVRRQVDKDALNGDDLVSPRVLSEIEAAGLAPHDERCLKVGRELLKRTDVRGCRQVLRTVVLVGRLMRALRLREELLDVGASAALLFGLAFRPEEGDGLSALDDSIQSREMRRQLAKSIELSAERVARELGRNDVAAVLVCCAQLVGHGRCESTDPDIQYLAAILFGAELVGRVCFQNGWWDPRHARRILDRLETGWVEDLQPALAVALTRIVTAAIADRPRGFVVPRHLRNDPALVERAQAQRAAKPGAGESTVAFVDLEPGMRLARGVATFDGHPVLETDAVLDHDLIWRLWRLAAVRPLNGPVFVSGKRR